MPLPTLGEWNTSGSVLSSSPQEAAATPSTWVSNLYDAPSGSSSGGGTAGILHSGGLFKLQHGATMMSGKGSGVGFRPVPSRHSSVSQRDGGRIEVGEGGALADAPRGVPNKMVRTSFTLSPTSAGGEGGAGAGGLPQKLTPPSAFSSFLSPNASDTNGMKYLPVMAPSGGGGGEGGRGGGGGSSKTVGSTSFPSPSLMYSSPLMQGSPPSPSSPSSPSSTSFGPPAPPPSSYSSHPVEGRPGEGGGGGGGSGPITTTTDGNANATGGLPGPSILPSSPEGSSSCSGRGGGGGAGVSWGRSGSGGRKGSERSVSWSSENFSESATAGGAAAARTGGAPPPSLLLSSSSQTTPPPSSSSGAQAGAIAATPPPAPSAAPPSSVPPPLISWKCAHCGYYLLAMDQFGRPLPLSRGAYGEVIPIGCPRCQLEHTGWDAASPFDSLGEHANLRSGLLQHQGMLLGKTNPGDHHEVAGEAGEGWPPQRQPPHQGNTGNTGSLLPPDPLLLGQKKEGLGSPVGSASGGAGVGSGAVSPFLLSSSPSSPRVLQNLALYSRVELPPILANIGKRRRRKPREGSGEVEDGGGDCPSAGQFSSNYYRSNNNNNNNFCRSSTIGGGGGNRNKLGGFASSSSALRRAFYCGLCGRRLLRMDSDGELVGMDVDAEGQLLPIRCPGCLELHNKWEIKPFLAAGGVVGERLVPHSLKKDGL